MTYTVMQTAKLTKIQSTKIYTMLRDGLIQGERKGKSWEIPQSEIDRLQRERSEGQAAASK